MADNEIKKRNTAYKVSISLIAKGGLELENDGQGRERFKYVTIGDKAIIRVNVIANVIDKFQSAEKAYTALTIDDGTGNMRVKAFGDSTSLLKNIEMGDSILVIGRIGYFNNELYILPEIVKQQDARWLMARKLELTKEFGNIYADEKIEMSPAAPAKEKEAENQLTDNTDKVIEEKIERTLTLREQILEIIKNAEAEEGIDIDKLIMQMHQPVDDIKNSVTEMLESGEIFEPRPGRLRIL